MLPLLNNERRVHIANSVDSLSDALFSDVMATVRFFHIHCTFRSTKKTHESVFMLLLRARRKNVSNCSIWFDGTFYDLSSLEQPEHYVARLKEAVSVSHAK